MRSREEIEERRDEIAAEIENPNWDGHRVQLLEGFRSALDWVLEPAEYDQRR